MFRLAGLAQFMKGAKGPLSDPSDPPRLVMAMAILTSRFRCRSDRYIVLRTLCIYSCYCCDTIKQNVQQL